MRHVPRRMFVLAHRSENGASFQGEGVEIVMCHVAEIYILQGTTRLLAAHIVAEFERPGAHDSVEESGELQFAANGAPAGASLNLGALMAGRLLRVFIAFVALE